LKYIELTQGFKALIDDEDFEKVSKFKWWYSQGYAGRFEKKNCILMHRFIMNTPPGMDTDHKDLNTLNNQKYNLRICTRKQNQGNIGLRKDNTSGYKGVTWNKATNKWLAYIYHEKKFKNLGNFSDILDAAQAYDKAAIFYYEEFAKLNFPENENLDNNNELI
jgi:hypothetical protein